MDRMVSAAVAAAASDVAGAPTRVLSAVPSAPPPSRPPRSLRPWLAAAAAIVVAGLVTAGLLSRNGGGPEEQADKPNVEARADQDSGGGTAGPAPSSTSSSTVAGNSKAAPGTSAPATTDETDVMSAGSGLGDFATADQLLAAVRQESNPSAGPKRSTSGDAVAPNVAETCAARQDSGDPSRGKSTFFAEARYRGQPVVVHIYTTADGERLVATPVEGECRDVLDVPYTP